MKSRRVAVPQSIVVIDVEGFGDRYRTTRNQLAVRDGLYRTVRDAFQRAGISWGDLHAEDRGDGVLILVPARVPKLRLVESLPSALVAGLRAHNSGHARQEQIRLRMALHAGEVFYDDHGVTAAAVNLTFRLVEAEPLKAALAGSPGVLAVIVSSWFFDEVVRHGPAADAVRYRPVRVAVKETETTAWICFPERPYPPDPSVLHRSPATLAAPGEQPGLDLRTSPEPQSDTPSIAIGRQVGQAIQGRNIYVHGQMAGSPTVAGEYFAWTYPHELPEDVVPFVGRDHESGRLEALLRSPDQSGAPVLITGTAGCGKSALAAHLAHRVADAYPDGQLWVRLEGVSYESSRSGDILKEPLESLGVPASAMPRTRAWRAIAYRSLLARRRVLIVLDGAEDTRQIEDLLPGDSSCAVIVTSRRDLPSLERAAQFDLAGLASSESVRLLEQIADMRIKQNIDAARRLCDTLGHNPLAIRIAGSILAGNPDLMIADLEGRIAAKSADHRTENMIDNVINFSYRQLNKTQSTTFCQVALLPGTSFDVRAAAAVLGATDETTSGLLDELVAQNLLIRESRHMRRFRFHGLARAYAREIIRRGALQDLSAARERYHRWYLSRAETAVSVLDLASNNKADARAITEAVSWLESEHENLLEVAKEAVEAHKYDYVWRIAEALYPFYHIRGYWADLQTIHEIALNAARTAGDDAAAERILNNLGIAYREQRRYGDAISCFEESVAISRTIDSTATRSTALMNLAVVYLEQDHHSMAIRSLEEALSTARELGQLSTEAQILGNMGNAYNALGRYQEALIAQRQCLDMSRSIGDVHGEGACLLNLGLIHHAEGREVEAIRSYRDGLKIARDIGDRGIECRILQNLGSALLAYGSTADAIRDLQASLSIAREIGDTVAAYGIASDLGAAELSADHHASAVRWYEESRQVAQELGSPAKEAYPVTQLAEAYESLGELDRALELWREGITLLREASNYRGLVSALTRIGRVLLTLDRADEAARYFEESAGIARDLDDKLGELAALMGVATAYEELSLSEDVMVIRRRVATLRAYTSSPADREE